MIQSLLVKYRRWWIHVCHILTVVISVALAFALRFDFSIPPAEMQLISRGVILAVVLKTAVFHLAGLGQGWWRFVGVRDLYRIFLANVMASVLFSILCRLTLGARFPRSIYPIDFLLCFLGVAGARFAVRLYYEGVASELNKSRGKGMLIYGAGQAGMTLLREILANPALGYDVIGFLDDDRNKRQASFMGVPVLGAGRDAPAIVDRHKRDRRKIEEILIAMPSATGRLMQEALANCRAAGVACKTVPGIGDLLSGKVLTSQIRNVDITDLLGREPVRLEEDRIRSAIAGRAVLVTGAGGSIGSELCRQVARFDPRVLIPFDQAESDLFKIDLELRQKFPSLELKAELGDIRDFERVDQVIRRYSVECIFHAAAYKHVPMMEEHVLEAARNNVLGTNNLVRAARRNGVADFLLISSDKAVRPSNVMGLTKRIAELIVSARPAGERGTKFVSVRFGNVLGSNGSVVPLFQAQIAAGGPVTVTHPDVRRYFMTVREAVQLVLQAFAMGKGSEIFLLDMGEAVRILDLACNLIRLSGRIPQEDVEIRFIGLRPGEKLYEELITQGEGIVPTYHEKIKILSAPGLDAGLIEAWIEDLQKRVDLRDEQGVLGHLTKLVPEYKSSGVPAAALEDQMVRAAAGD